MPDIIAPELSFLIGSYSSPPPIATACLPLAVALKPIEVAFSALLLLAQPIEVLPLEDALEARPIAVAPSARVLPSPA